MAFTTPRTWTTGDNGTATILNTHLRDNMSYAIWPDDSWTTLSPTGWSILASGGGRALAYRVINAGTTTGGTTKAGQLQLRGTISIASALTAGTYTLPGVTLPAAARPAQNRYFPVASNDTYGLNKAQIGSGGTISFLVIGAAMTWVSFEGVSFDLDN